VLTLSCCGLRMLAWMLRLPLRFLLPELAHERAGNADRSHSQDGHWTEEVGEATPHRHTGGTPGPLVHELGLDEAVPGLQASADRGLGCHGGKAQHYGQPGTPQQGLPGSPPCFLNLWCSGASPHGLTAPASSTGAGAEFLSDGKAQEQGTSFAHLLAPKSESLSTPGHPGGQAPGQLGAVGVPAASKKLVPLSGPLARGQMSTSLTGGQLGTARARPGTGQTRHSTRAGCAGGTRRLARRRRQKPWQWNWGPGKAGPWQTGVGRAAWLRLSPRTRWQWCSTRARGVNPGQP